MEIIEIVVSIIKLYDVSETEPTSVETRKRRKESTQMGPLQMILPH
jgi:hypothetical protein